MYYGASPEIEITNFMNNENVESVEMCYVPEHLERIIYELLRGLWVQIKLFVWSQII